jgi:hypothetical protein
MELYMRCFYAALIMILIVIIAAVIEQDKQEELKYHSGLPYSDKIGATILQDKARDGALSGLLMGTLSGGPVTGLLMAGKYAMVGPIVSGVGHLKNTNYRVFKK